MEYDINLESILELPADVEKLEQNSVANLATK